MLAAERSMVDLVAWSLLDYEDGGPYGLAPNRLRDF
jgi:hypothetical protein